MKKKALGRITALGIAALTAVPAFSIVASAEVTVTSAWRIPTGKDAYGVYTYAYYNSQAEANAANTYNENGNKIAPVSVTSIPNISVGSNIYITSGGQILPGTAPDGAVAGKWGGSASSGTSSGTSTGSGGYTFDNVPSTYRYATSKRYKSRATGRWYPNLTMLGAIEGSGIIYEEENLPANSPSWSSTNQYFDYTQGVYTNSSSGTVLVSSSNYSGYSNNYYSSTYRYYSSRTGLFYTTNADAVAASGGYASYVTDYYTNSSSTRTSTYIYYSRYTGRYYATREAAVIASGDNASYVDGTGNYTVYYSPYTGRYYDSYSAASAATPAGYTVRTITNSVYSASYLNTYGYNGYYDSYYYGYYNDPNYYYYYYLMGNNSTTNTKDTSTVTIGNYKGWTNVARVINAAKAGSSYTVDMQTETEIPTTVLTALKGKNIDMNFRFSGGAVLTINGNDITNTAAISPVIKYQSTSIPSTLKKKAVKANSGVSSSQFTINGGSFGADASVTIKFNTKRAGCSAKLYRYNSSANTLSLVSRSAVQSNGQCKFDNVKQGGEYIVVLS